MKNPSKRILAFIFAGFFGVTIRAQDLDTLGVTLLRTVTTNLNGSGIRVAQPEAIESAGTTNFEVNPGAVGQPVSLFTYISSGGTTNNFPNALGGTSGHAGNVAGNFYGMSGGVATNVAHVDNFDADFFYTNYIADASLTAIGDSVVNQSFTFGNVTNDFQTNGVSPIAVSDQQAVDSQYDDYAAQNKTLFISAVNNQDSVSPPGTSYNCIGVAAYGGSSSVGPTLDNGRCKPDITAPAGVTSYSTPQIAGAAAVLMQAGLRGDGGGDTNSAADIRTVKALLLNGAIKPADWTNNPPSPLDTRYGAGVLNVFNSYKQLAGGRHGYIFSTNIPAGTGHPPTGAANSVSAMSGWDFNTNSSSSTTDGVNHYYFNVTNGTGNAAFAATATLVWNRHRFQTSINNLDLFLYDAVSSNLVACSTSLVDNVEHIFVPKLAQGRYALQVWKAGGVGIVSTAEPYALVWEFFSTSLNASKSGTNISISWPVYPDGFVLQTATNLVLPLAWSTNNPAPVVTNGQNVVRLNATNANRFFRLQRP